VQDLLLYGLSAGFGLLVLWVAITWLKKIAGDEPDDRDPFHDAW
jgi:hypothetical protein